MNYDYFQEVLNSGFEDYEFLPLNFQPSKFLSFETAGWDPMTLICYDKQLNIILKIFSGIFKEIFQEYSETYIFCEPKFIFRPATEQSSWKVELKIEMLDKEIYEQISQKKND